MRSSQPPRPTPAELAILRMLWLYGASTVREVQERLGEPQTGYTTILKLLQVMSEKGLVERDEGQRAHVYWARFQEEQTQRQLVGDLLDRAFGGSPGKLVLQALSTRPASAAELVEIRSLLSKLEEKAS